MQEPQWIPAHAAFDILRKQYRLSHTSATIEDGRDYANKILLTLLEEGNLRGRASMVHLNIENGFSIDQPSSGNFDENGDIERNLPVLPDFWRHFQASDVNDRKSDWIEGDFSFTRHGVAVLGFVPSCEASIYRLEVDANDLPTEIKSEVALAAVPPMRRGGRPAANWWPDFAEELAVYVYENGIPEGQGHDGQSALIDAVFGRMAERGKGEPGRGTVQTVINAVLRRIRSAGN